MKQEKTKIRKERTIISIAQFSGLFLAMLETCGIFDHVAIVAGGIIGDAFSFTLNDMFESILNGLWLRFLELITIGDRIMAKTEKLDGKVMDVRLTSITIIDMDTRVHVVVPYKSITGKVITNATRAIHAIVEEKFTILLKDHDMVNDIIRCSNERLRLDISAESFYEVSAIGKDGIKLRVLYRVKMVNHSGTIGKGKFWVIHHSILIGMAKIIQSSGATIGKVEKKKDDKGD
ncbi:hypothetical protein Dsin_027593 [Dipteronia sinensis]|uniref:Mechanosensitive ion channel MscS domain-containing protein n=1 Tax=Dipteronia sinensis TaxID=43782 RepID=A0AAD9ZQ80_9ROSI|nr:hypothetical protein Dsin_027593 [Dipteronia sinensis]